MIAYEFDNTGYIAEWVSRRIPEDPEPFPSGSWGMGILIDRKPAAAWVFSHYDGRAMRLSCAVDDPRAITRRTLRDVFAYPFDRVGCERLTCMVGACNEKSIDRMPRLGFQPEGRLRRGLPTCDLLIFGMLWDECPWLKRRSDVLHPVADLLTARAA